MEQHEQISGEYLLQAQREFSLPQSKEFSLGTIDVPNLESTEMLGETDNGILESALLYTDLMDEEAARQYLVDMSDEGLRRSYAILMKLAGSAMVELVKRKLRRSV